MKSKALEGIVVDAKTKVACKSHIASIFPTACEGLVKMCDARCLGL